MVLHKKNQNAKVLFYYLLYSIIIIALYLSKLIALTETHDSAHSNENGFDLTFKASLTIQKKTCFQLGPHDVDNFGEYK